MDDGDCTPEDRWSDLQLAPSAVLKHAFFARLKTMGFDFTLLRAFVDQYVVVSHAFPRFLASVIARIEDEQLALPAVNNLWDEFGHGKPAAGHRRILSRFLHAAEGLTLPRKGPVRAETAVFVNGLYGIGNRENIAVCFGALSFFEAVTPAEYTVIVEALKKLHPFSNRELAFFLDHMNHDSAHLNILTDAVAGRIGPCGQADFAFGIRQALVLENALWDGILAATQFVPG